MWPIDGECLSSACPCIFFKCTIAQAGDEQLNSLSLPNESTQTTIPSLIFSLLTFKDFNNTFICLKLPSSLITQISAFNIAWCCFSIRIIYCKHNVSMLLEKPLKKCQPVVKKEIIGRFCFQSHKIGAATSIISRC